MSGRLLFAYGSNMAEGEMSAFAPGARFVGVARLDGFALAFRRRSLRWGGGAADILAAPGSEVWGVLYELSNSDIEALDAKEGAGLAYRRREVTVEHRGSAVAAFAYEVIDKEPAEVPPAQEYAELLRRSARDRGLPAAYAARFGDLGGHIHPNASNP